MTNKRSRETYEAQIQAEYSPFVFYGTPLPPHDPDIRDDGSYVPIWKQEVRDEKGLKRLHGAFTGGFSAGYFNTVGSKEGWTPTTFTSSRLNRNDKASVISQKKPEDFMDEEDIRDAEDARKIEIAAGFSGLGSTADDKIRRGTLLDLFRVEGDTMGVKLLRKMGWKPGQGIGPKVRRAAQLQDDTISQEIADSIHYFAPEDVPVITILNKSDYKGLGYRGEAKTHLNQVKNFSQTLRDEDEEDSQFIGFANSKNKKPASTGFGVGILNDTGSDDEDPYEIGPQISYNRFVYGDWKKHSKKKVTSRAVNPLVAAKPVYISKKVALAKANTGLQKCYDGSLPLDGFLLSNVDESSIIQSSFKKYQPPQIPEGWKSSRQTDSHLLNTPYQSTSEAARLSKLDPKSRASILGELSLPGKSVFDFLSPAARERVAEASGKHDLPPALGQVPKEYSMTEEERLNERQTQIPKVDKSTANAALSRAESGFIPYSDDIAKRNRYRAYLEYQSGISTVVPSKSPNVSDSEWFKELREFANCAQIFKPMSGSMATRFVSSTITSQVTGTNPQQSTLLSKPTPKPEDPAEQAARLSMYGPLTRCFQEWYPSRLLCKRFNVNPPAQVTSRSTEHSDRDFSGNTASELVSKSAINAMMRDPCHSQSDIVPHRDTGASINEAQSVQNIIAEIPVQDLVIDPGRNEALEGQRAGEALFQAIFGDDSDDE